MVVAAPYSDTVLRMDTYRATSIGILAQAVVRESDALSALAVFDRSLYLTDGCDRALCLLGPGMEPGPLHLIVDRVPPSFRSRVAVGDTISVEPRRLAGKTLAIDLTHAELWSPPAFAGEKPSAGFVKKVLLPALLDAAPEGSLFRVAFGQDPDNSADPLWNALKAATRDGLAELSAWLQNPLQAPLPTRLLGLGHGLTPSGDDILAGAMLALHAAGEGGRARNLVLALTPLLNSKTNRISAAHLCAAGLGEGAAVFHDCLRRISAGQVPSAELRRINAVGHSSGWDALLGMVWCLSASRPS